MSRRHKHRAVREQVPERKAEGGAIVSTFSAKTGVEMRNTNDLMNWIIFGDTKSKFYQPEANEGF